uniref:Myosin motor domain-containing protein n=1 Tax=Hyaloperonospora arabidopsidis (strain Emoy2) TaxID=559515 RepID=M4BHL6_HYAAE
MDEGARVWVTDPAKSHDRVWLAARVLEAQATALRVAIDNDSDETSDDHRDVRLAFAASGACVNVLPRNQAGEQDQRDLVALPHLHEASILHALRLRYARHAIYTHIGDILISINPFERLPQLYSDNVLQRYAYEDSDTQFSDTSADDASEPHLFAVARAAYMDIVQNGRSQAILISGESGAGKTEATKIIMTYFAITCGARKSNDKHEVAVAKDSNLSVLPSSRPTIEEQILQSNPILEAFGNARTVRNDNSSRFGKFIELRFRDERRRLAGARIRTYLLEKIRVIKQATNERNFHIFYELLSADSSCVSEEQRQALAITGGPQNFRLLNQSRCSKRRDGVKDAVQFRATQRAMLQLGMSEREVHGVLEIVAAVLHMGNVDFEQVPHQREDNVFADEARTVTSSTGECDHFTKAAELLGVSTEALDHALTKRQLHVSNETLVVGVDVAQARNTRNAVTMECYRLLFEWLVARVNDKLQQQPWSAGQGDDEDDEKEADFIGLLDIFGFEDMAENSFEQLCINYANEALQHQFNQYVFEEEQRLYRDEDICWSFVDFPNNRACLELYERRPIGIFSLTDQECVFPQGTDRALVAKYYQEFEKKTQHPHFRPAPLIQRSTQFVVAHYAGCVTYTIDGFLAKNKDSLGESAVQLLAGSSNPLIQALAAGSVDENEARTDAEVEGSGGRARRRAKSAIAAVSVGTQFKIQLNELLATVRATTPRYVRCIKPNDSHVGSLFHSKRVVEQLRSGGVLEAVRVARAGFPVRLSHKQFLDRYHRVLLSLCKSGDSVVGKKQSSWSEMDLCLHQLMQVLADKTMEDRDGDDEKNCQARLGVSLGKTRVFFRRKPYEKLENLRVSVRQEASLVIQRHVRGFMARSSYRHLRQVTIKTQARVRRQRACRYVCWLREMQRARVLQARMRQLCARSRFLRARAGVLAVQCRFRCRRAARVVEVLRKARAVTRISTAWRRSAAQRKYRKLCSAVLALQCAARYHVAKRALKVLRQESRNVAKLKQDNAQLKDELAELRRQVQVMVAQSVSKEYPPSPFLPLTVGTVPACDSYQKTVVVSSDDASPEVESNQRDCQIEAEPEVTVDLRSAGSGDDHSDTSGRDVDCTTESHDSRQTSKPQTPKVRRVRRSSLPPILASANEDAEVGDITPPVSPRAPRSRDRRHSLDLWRLQELKVHDEACQLREEIREVAAVQPSPERQLQQEIALQKLVTAQIKREAMRLQLQAPELALKVENNCIDASVSCKSQQSRSCTVGSPLRIVTPLTSYGQRSSSRWNIATPRSMTHATGGCTPAYFDSPVYAGSSYADDRSVDGEDDLYGRNRRYSTLRRAASAGMYRSRSSSNASTCYTSSLAVPSGVAVPRFAKAPICYECDCKFNLLVRRHHCRQCGHSFCYEHSTRQLALPHLGYMAAQRVCDTCFEAHIQAMTSYKLPSLVRHPTDALSTSSFASSPRNLGSGGSCCSLESPVEDAARVVPLQTQRTPFVAVAT